MNAGLPTSGRPPFQGIQKIARLAKLLDRPIPASFPLVTCHLTPLQTFQVLIAIRVISRLYVIKAYNDALREKRLTKGGFY